ncbi:MAG: kynureninase [Xanthobacteraceae bacterium]
MPQELTREAFAARDKADPLRRFRDKFVVPEGLIYLDGNSLGMLPQVCAARVRDVVEHEWGQSLISSWNDHDWIGLPLRAGSKIAPLIGADPDEVVVCDSVSINLFKVLASAIALRPDRRVIVTTKENFPTDVYIAEGLCRLLGNSYKLRFAAPERVDDVLDDQVAAVSFSHVDFKSARIEDMAAISAKAQKAGALAIWDLSHSAGALPVELNLANADFAVGCSYKYLNGGPGAPAFLFAARRHHATMTQPLSGWLGHATPFAFDSHYTPAPGIARMITGTPPVISMASVEVAVEIIAEAGIGRLRQKSKDMTSLLIALVAQECGDMNFELASLADAERRGSHVIFSHPDGYAVTQALKTHGVVGDFRAPNFVRLGIAPIYLSYVELWDAVQRLKEVLHRREWDHDRFRVRAAVT